MDPLIEWAAQAETRRWRNDDAIVVAAPDLARRDRLVVSGRPAAVAGLLAEAYAETGPGYHAVGDEDVMAALPGLGATGHFLWMDTTDPAPGDERGAWLETDDGVAEFLAMAAPRSFAMPGGTGVRRWAAVRDDDGALIATAAEAWSAPGLGFIAGVATHPDRRGQGLAGALCRFVTNDLMRSAGRVALLTDVWNEAAQRTYRRLGYSLRPLMTAQPAVVR
ncbi:GNAT family N-acetyltransferase [Actinoplanes sp. NPDC049265]|uniref:GNAT family N-acetyltransferase n=1 Tax=Actinoplanes sp. NPDC049265 TaxID=3363902 RepID=UPI003718B953